MSTNNSNSDDIQEIRERKPVVKINKKMRTWNKYKNLCFIAGGILVVVLLVMGITSIMPKVDSGDENNTVAETKKDYISQLESLEDETKNSQEESTAASGDNESKAPAETQTQGTGKVPDVETFTTKDKFNGVVFVGDTVVNGIAHYKNLPSSQIVSDVNMLSSQLTGMVSQVMASNPQKVMIMVGLNDANNTTCKADSIISNIEKFVKAVKAQNSSTEVYVLSVLPVTQEFETKSEVRQELLNEINAAFSSKASSLGVKYIDVATGFKDSTGYLFSECTGTGYNLKQAYYPYMLNKIASLM